MRKNEDMNGIKNKIDANELLYFKQGAVLMRQGELGDYAYLLLEGRLQIQRKADDGEQLIIGTVEPFDLVGELSILGGMPRCATVTVLEDAKLLKINKVRLKKIVRRYPDIAEIVIKVLCKRIEFNAEKLVETYIERKNRARPFETKSNMDADFSDTDPFFEEQTSPKSTKRRRHRLVSMEHREKRK